MAPLWKGIPLQKSFQKVDVDAQRQTCVCLFFSWNGTRFIYYCLHSTFSWDEKLLMRKYPLLKTDDKHVKICGGGESTPRNGREAVFWLILTNGSKMSSFPHKFAMLMGQFPNEQSSQDPSSYVSHSFSLGWFFLSLLPSPFFFMFSAPTNKIPPPYSTKIQLRMGTINGLFWTWWPAIQFRDIKFLSYLCRQLKLIDN